jgi:hypothetical protein
MAHSIDEATERDVREVEAIVAAKRKPFVTYVASSIPAGSAKNHKAYETAQFLKNLYTALPVFAETVWTAEDAFLKTDDGAARLPDAWGDTCYRILSSRPIDQDMLAHAGYKVFATSPIPDRMTIELSFPGSTPESTTTLVSAFLNEASISHVLRKTGFEAELAIAEKGLKKRNVLAARIFPDAEGYGICTIVVLECGAKYDLHGLAALAAKRGIAYGTRVSAGLSFAP